MERYINPHTDFGFKRLFDQAEISKFNSEDLKSYEDSVNAYRDIVNAIKTAEKKNMRKVVQKERNLQKKKWHLASVVTGCPHDYDCAGIRFDRR